MEAKKLEYWTKFSFDKMRKEKVTMPMIIPQIINMEEFKNSGITPDELRQSIKDSFEAERNALITQWKKVSNDKV